MGTAAWQNWRAYDAGSEKLETFEDELHSDVRFSGAPVELGPYRLSLVHRLGDHPEVSVSLLLEGDIHTWLVPEVVVDGQIVPTDKENYFGGALADEIVALVSLELGVRLRFAGTRMTSGFNGNDPLRLAVTALGRPGTPGREVVPFVMSRAAAIDSLTLVPAFSRLDEADERAVVRAAMAYSNAIWWANQDPGQAWLQLVTALEVAAKHQQARGLEPTSVIADVDPDLWAELLQVPEPTRGRLAKRLAPPLRATLTFKRFVAGYAPEPPEPRNSWEQLDWTRMEEHAAVIYRHRSDWLHKGVPLPLPLIDTRTETDRDGAPAEVPGGHNVGGLGGIWTADEYPMTLSLFEYITRGALLRWWSELPLTGDELAGQPQTPTAK